MRRLQKEGRSLSRVGEVPADESGKEEIMANKLVDKEPSSDSSHKPAKHIEETARLASSVEKTRIPPRFEAPRINPQPLLTRRLAIYCRAI